MRIELNCAECDGNHFSLDQGLSDRSLVICDDCGREIGTVASLKVRVTEELIKRSAGFAEADDGS
jgi:hypothetical protein